jgi:hypothetical protein
MHDNSDMNESELNKLRALPQRRGEVWQGGLVRMPSWVTGEDAGPYRPYLPLWIAVRDDKVHAGRLLRPEELNPAAMVSALIEFALEEGTERRHSTPTHLVREEIKALEEEYSKAPVYPPLLSGVKITPAEVKPGDNTFDFSLAK